ncbi:hypothetical protein [Kineosporia babensis]|uniref:Uncharacterized protein n=1 Tax=Kineosporia babensis TaxID=499548 RepID=A0A9X1T0Z5_9ACTN|nr:hypothetical protein [Kineosporia babensis]MCD5313318.1 hypothetical protein [Kineosporia babensis]
MTDPLGTAGPTAPIPRPTVIADEFLRGLRIAAMSVTSVVLIFIHLPVALQFTDAYRWPAADLGALVAMLAVVAVAAVFVALDRPWSWLRWVLLAVVFVACVGGTVAVEPEYLIDTPHWSWEMFGWFAVLLLLDLRLRWFFGALLGQYAVTAALILGQDAAHAPMLVEFGVTGLLAGAWQSTVALFSIALRRSAEVALRTAVEEEQLRTFERVAEQLHRDRQARYADLAVTTAPLLAGLASGQLNPADSGVQRACSVEASRMRRLFAESDDVADPLEHEIHACVDVAERRGTAVQMSTRGSLPALPLPVRRALTEPVIAALAGARSAARVTVTGQTSAALEQGVGMQDSVTLSVVTDGAQDGAVEVPEGEQILPGAGGGIGRAGGRVRVSRLRSGDRLWVEVTWQAQPAQPIRTVRAMDDRTNRQRTVRV